MFAYTQRAHQCSGSVGSSTMRTASRIAPFVRPRQVDCWTVTDRPVIVEPQGISLILALEARQMAMLSVKNFPSRRSYCFRSHRKMISCPTFWNGAGIYKCKHRIHSISSSSCSCFLSCSFSSTRYSILSISC